MAFGPVEGSAIPLLRAHQPAALETLEKPKPQSALEGASDGFLELLVRANERGHSANHMSQELAAGRSDDIHGTMIEFSKAGIEARLVTSVRDKVMEAFHEIWRMSV